MLKFIYKACSIASSINRNFYFKNILKSRFLVEFQNFIFELILAVLGSFGQFGAILGRIGCIDSGRELA
jgi:hypothetical protein